MAILLNKPTTMFVHKQSIDVLAWLIASAAALALHGRPPQPGTTSWTAESTPQGRRDGLGICEPWQVTPSTGHIENCDIDQVLSFIVARSVAHLPRSGNEWAESGEIEVGWSGPHFEAENVHLERHLERSANIEASWLSFTTLMVIKMSSTNCDFNLFLLGSL